MGNPIKSAVRLIRDAASQALGAAGLLRRLPAGVARWLPAGASNYRAYVGPPAHYERMGELQFETLRCAGLEPHHRLLDFGCGSLRAGRLLIPYLDAGGYVGLDPNRWLIDDGLARELDAAVIADKRPAFFNFDDFRADRCGTEFDFLLAHSILTHTGPDLTDEVLRGFAAALKPGGTAVFTIYPPGGPYPESEGSGWIYPGCVAYSAEAIVEKGRRAGLKVWELGEPHPWHVWYAGSPA